MPTVITLTQPSGSSIILATADLVYATRNGSVTTLTQENNQTMPIPILVTEDLATIEALDDNLLTVTDLSGNSILLSGLRIKSVEDITTFRKIKYEGVGMVNTEFRVSETISAIQDAINSATPAAIIASGEFNLKDVGANVIILPANSAPTGIIVSLTENDTYTAIATPAVQGSLQLSVDSGYTAGDPTNSYRWNVNGVNIVNFSGQTLATKEDVIVYILANTLNDWTSSNPSGDIIIFTEPLTGAGTRNGQTLAAVSGIDGGSIDYSGLTAVSGGETAVDTSFKLEKDGVELLLIGGADALTLIALLVYGSTLQSAISSSLISDSGDLALPVTVGAQDDFRIKIQILGVRID